MEKKFFKKAFKCLPNDACHCPNILRRNQIFGWEWHHLGHRGCVASNWYRACKFLWWDWRVQLFSLSPIWYCRGYCACWETWHIYWGWCMCAPHSWCLCHSCGHCTWSSLGCRYSHCRLPCGLCHSSLGRSPWSPSLMLHLSLITLKSSVMSLMSLLASTTSTGAGTGNFFSMSQSSWRLCSSLM